MLDVTRLRALLLTGAIVAWAPAALPAAQAAGNTGANQTTATTDLRQQQIDLRKYLSTHPNDVATHLKLGHLYINVGNYDAAEEQARAAQHHGGQTEDDADALLAWALFLESHNDRLLREIKPDDRKPSDESVVRLSLAEATLRTTSLAAAEPLFRDAVRLDPTAWRAHMGLAGLLILKRRLPEAREQLATARVFAPDAIGITRMAAVLDRAAGDTNGAIDKFGDVIKRHPTSVPSLAGRADALISLDKLAEAQKDVNAARHLVSNPELVFLDALILSREGRFDEAARGLVMTTQVMPQMPIGYYLYGMVNFWLGLPETADDYLSRFQSRQPNVSGVARVQAEIALQRKDTTKAIALLEPLVEADAWDQAAAAMLGQAYLDARRPDQVIELYQKLATALPPQGPPPVDVGGLRMFWGDVVGDLTEIEKVIEKQAPEVVVPMNALRDGDIAKASAMAESLAETSPDNPWVQNLLGSVRLAQKRLPEAEAIFRRIQDKRPDFAAADFNLVDVLVAEKRLDDARAMLQELEQRKLDDSAL